MSDVSDYTSWVMSAGMKNDHRVGRSSLQIFTETGKVQTLALRIPIPK